MRFARQKLYKFGDKPGRYLANLVKERADSQPALGGTWQLAPTVAALTNGLRGTNFPL